MLALMVMREDPETIEWFITVENNFVNQSVLQLMRPNCRLWVDFGDGSTPARDDLPNNDPLQPVGDTILNKTTNPTTNELFHVVER